VTGFLGYVYADTCSISCYDWFWSYIYPWLVSTCSSHYAPGTDVPLHAGSECDEFLGWSDGPQSWDRTVKMTSNMTLTARFSGCI
jgi:hypothetical protein